eukprot:2723418-Amphidinium_carterae.1
MALALSAAVPLSRHGNTAHSGRFACAPSLHGSIAARLLHQRGVVKTSFAMPLSSSSLCRASKYSNSRTSTPSCTAGVSRMRNWGTCDTPR